MTACDSCHRPCVAVFVMAHRRKGEAAPIEWSVGACCATGVGGGETTKRGK